MNDNFRLMAAIDELVDSRSNFGYTGKSIAESKRKAERVANGFHGYFVRAAMNTNRGMCEAISLVNMIKDHELGQYKLDGTMHLFDDLIDGLIKDHPMWPEFQFKLQHGKPIDRAQAGIWELALTTMDKHGRYQTNNTLAHDILTHAEQYQIELKNGEGNNMCPMPDYYQSKPECEVFMVAWPVSCAGLKPGKYVAIDTREHNIEDRFNVIPKGYRSDGSAQGTLTLLPRVEDF